MCRELEIESLFSDGSQGIEATREEGPSPSVIPGLCGESQRLPEGV